MNPYQKLQQRKRKWSPVQTTAGKLNEGAEEAIFRALAMRHMELPVGEFILDALKNEVPEVARDILLSNIKDEENHDLALGYIANAIGVDEKAEAEAKKLRDAWIAHPDHTLLKALVAERAIFFVLLKNNVLRWPTFCGRVDSTSTQRREQWLKRTNKLKRWRLKALV
jgi:hypothetical protein